MPARKKSGKRMPAGRAGADVASAEPAASRPYMPGYGLPQKTKGMLPWKWAEQKLTSSKNYFFASTRPDGRPHVMPIWGIWVDSVFYFSTGRDSRKGRNLAADPHCVVCTERAEAAAVVEGVAEEVTDMAMIKDLDAHYSRKYKPWHLDPKLGSVFAVRPRVVFGLYEEKFVETATRWKFGE